ncbi:viral ankyrin 1 [Bracoviriform demolitoris]|uniref:I-kappa-B like protein N2 n=1 Tax=Microplitis demolitor bracovirus (isolate Webb) TaxID=654919 RepID=IKBN2_MDBVW|nr:viral ankyrin-4 [Microplitis demolitor]YP_239402.1 viral ankyrin 1 [Bracoviriform demolitoris]Q5I126.1 RecName: Full=I-kappa-B like protein N2 [Microplitis demolitor bracovirus (isolate Webb)]AAW51806.1 viral ankyrin 1 [Bracoviriform demolitoris]KAG6558327.1 viral ankyrin N4 [Microplitis demolitor]
MDSSDKSNLPLLLEIDWERHEAYTGENIFHVIAKKGWLKMLCALEGLVDEKIKPWLRKWSRDGNTCLHEAALRNKGPQAIRIMEKLIEYGADLNLKSSCHKPVLHVAVERNDYELVAWICQQPGINLEAEDFYKFTAHQLASKKNLNNDKKMVKILETYGAIPRQDGSSEDEVSDSEEKSDSE